MKRVSVMLLAVMTLYACDYRVPSKKIFEEACGVKIPESYSVLEDKDHGKGDNRGIEYAVQLQGNSRKEFTESINNSPYYLYPDSPTDTGWKMKGVGYQFHRAFEGAVYNARFDTGKGVVMFVRAMK